MPFLKRVFFFIQMILILPFLTQCYLLKQESYILRYNSRAEKIQRLQREGAITEKEQALPVKKYKGDPEDFIKECITAAHSGGMS